MGSIFAIIAFLSWGFGDYFIQKTTRRFGDWLTLFYICLSASVILLPFIYPDIGPLFSAEGWKDLRILLLAGAVSTAAALCLFEGLRRGKIAVIDPIFSLEIIITASLAALFLGERLSGLQVMLIGVLFIGIILISVRGFHHFKDFKIEAGVIFALLATVLMGGENFLNGWGARLTDGLMVNWFISLFVTIVTFTYIVYSGQVKNIIPDIRRRPGLLAAVCFTDNLGWIAYSYSMTYIPMAMATGISEGYIALAAVLGLTLNKEKIKLHQIIGLIVTLAAAIGLTTTLK